MVSLSISHYFSVFEAENNNSNKINEWMAKCVWENRAKHAFYCSPWSFFYDYIQKQNETHTHTQSFTLLKINHGISEREDLVAEPPLLMCFGVFFFQIWPNETSLQINRCSYENPACLNPPSEPTNSPLTTHHNGTVYAAWENCWHQCIDVQIGCYVHCIHIDHDIDCNFFFCVACTMCIRCYKIYIKYLLYQVRIYTSNYDVRIRCNLLTSWFC